MKNWFKKWWNLDCAELDVATAYSNPWGIVFGAVLQLALYFWFFLCTKDETPSFDAKDLKVCALLVAFILCLVYLCVQISRSIKDGKVFSRRNARLIVRMGGLVELFSFVLLVVVGGTPHYWAVFMAAFSMLVGTALQMLGWMINRGVTMQEEQELTI